MLVRFAAIAAVALALAIAPVSAENAPPTDPKPVDKKAEEEALKARIVEILTKVKASDASELPIEDWNKIRDGAEAELFALGPVSIQFLLPYLDLATLKGILGKTDPEFAGRIKAVLKKLGWISPEMEAELKELMGKLRKKEVVPQEDSPRFRELGNYAVVALDQELRLHPLQIIREKICEILGDMGSAGILSAVDTLLFAISDPEPAVRLQAFRALSLTAREEDHFKELDERLVKLGAYELIVCHLAGDSDARIRLRAATVLGWMEAVNTAEALFAVLSSEKEENIVSEAVWALEMISAVETKSGEEWKARLARINEWWAKKKDSLPKQIKPGKPKIREKTKETDGEKKEGGKDEKKAG